MDSPFVSPLPHVALESPFQGCHVVILDGRNLNGLEASLLVLSIVANYVAVTKNCPLHTWTGTLAWYMASNRHT
jgi:hypothetical protein